MKKLLLLLLLLCCIAPACHAAPPPPVPRANYSLRVVYASGLGCAQDGTTDDTTKLQAALNRASTGTPLRLVMDGAGLALVSGLNVYGNTTIEAINGGGFKLKAASNRSILRNANRTTSTVTNKHITLRGLYLDGNGTAQTSGVTEADATTMTCLDFSGVQDFMVRDCTLYNSKAYGALINNATYVHIDNCTVAAVGTGTANQDGIHFCGNCQYITVANCKIWDYDDGLAFNADDGNTGPYVANGPITDVNVSNIQFTNALLGIRMLSDSNAIDRVVVNGVTGSIKNYLAVLDYFTFATHGAFGSVTIGNVDVTIQASVSSGAGGSSAALMNFNGAFDNLRLSNIRVRNPIDTRPLLWFHSNTDIKQFELDGFSIYDTNSAATGAVPIFLEGRLRRCVGRGWNWYRDAALTAATRMVQFSGSSSKIDALVLDQVFANNVSTLIDQAAGILTFVQATNIRHDNGSGQTFKCGSGAVTDVVLSNYYGPAAVATAGTGTAPSQRGDGFSSTPPIPGVNIYDAFTDTDNTLVTAHTIAPINTVSASYTLPSGSAKIVSNKATNNSAVATVVHAVADSALSSCTVTANVATGNATVADMAGVLFRYTDENNYWLVRFVYNSASATGTFQLCKMQAGTFTVVSVVSNTGAETPGTVHAISVICNGTVISATNNGGNTVSTTSSFNQTATKVGLFFYQDSGTPTLKPTVDDFRVSA